MFTNASHIFIFIAGLLSRHGKESRRGFKVCIDLLCLSAQATGFFIWPIVEIGKKLYLLTFLADD